MTEKRTPGKSAWAKHLVGIGMTLLSLFLIARQVNFAEVLEALRHFRWPFLALGIASLAAGYAFRIIRWAMMLRAAGAAVTFGTCSAPFLGSIALNNILPLRLGDVVRALVFPKAMGIARTTAASSLVVERLIDLLTLGASFAIGLFAIQAVGIPEEIKKSAVYLSTAGSAVLCAGFLGSARLSRFFARLAAAEPAPSGNGLRSVHTMLASLFSGFDAMSRPRIVFAMLLVSVLVWAGEAGLFYVVLAGLGIDAGPAVALLVMSVATLATLVPSSPGYVGPFHLAAFTAISLAGGTAAQAGSYAVLVHLALWLPTTLAGAIALLRRPELFRAARSQAA